MTRAVAVVAVLLALAATPAQDHSWYDASCCSDRDCRPLGDQEIRLNLETGEIEVMIPIVTWIGWVQANSIRTRRPSQDARYHLCVSATTGLPRCLYEPPGM